MAKPGRRPKPTNLKLLEGNPGCRPLPKHEPKGTAADLTCPAELDEYGRKAWNDLAPQLSQMGLLTTVDRHGLQCACQEFSVFARASLLIAKEPLVGMTPNGHITMHPAISISRRAGDSFRQWCSEYGLTPSARTRIEVKPEEDIDALERMLAGNGNV